MYRLLGIMIGLFLGSGAAHASGSELGESLGANSLGMGWVAVANPYDNAAVTVNPAMLSLEQRYDLLAGASCRSPPLLGLVGCFGGLETSKWLGLGVAYQRQKANPEMSPSDLPGWVPQSYVPSNERLAHDVTLAASTAVWDRRLSIGLNGTFNSYEHVRHGNGITGNMDIGIGLRPVRLLTVGLVGRNILPVREDSAV